MGTVTVGAVRERAPGERRVALVPEAVTLLRRAGVDVLVEAGAGSGAWFADADYTEAGATVVSPEELYARADAVLCVGPPDPESAEALRTGQTLIGLLEPLRHPALVDELTGRGVRTVSLDLLPRTLSRAQSMDALTSQANVAGYKAAVLAADSYDRFYPMLTTAAGTMRPAQVLVLGAGVAGLQAIATARRLGAVVRAYDVRAAAKEEVESLGARFVELDLETQEGAGGYAKEQSAEYLAKQQELLAAEVAASDVVITTAQIPGRPAPVLVSTAMVEGMGEGAVVVDMAADSGGNCELSEPGRDVVHQGVTVVGLTNPPSSMPTHASFLYARNIANFLDLLVKDGELAPDFEDEIVAGTCVVRAGTVVHGPTAEALGLPAPVQQPPAEAPETAEAPASEGRTEP
jgi:NAD(P) transhydrogenase subunit alpha